jgi:hypothetical protein
MRDGRGCLWTGGGTLNGTTAPSAPRYSERVRKRWKQPYRLVTKNEIPILSEARRHRTAGDSPVCKFLEANRRASVLQQKMTPLIYLFSRDEQV